MLTMQFLIVLTLFAVQSLAKPNIYKDFVDYAAFDYLNDPNHKPTEVKPECKIDLLIIWDNSRSIGKKTFDREVKDFFRNLINNEDLNVSPEGTHLSIITFSTQDRTKVLVEFGEKTTKAELLEYINGLDWSEVEGGATRTGRAFMLANQIFNQKSPLNGGDERVEVKDVVLIATDGKPIRDRDDPTYGFYDYDNKPEVYASKRRSHGEIKMANAYSAKLRENDIRVVGVYIGNNGDPKLLEKWTTTPSDAIQTNKAEFDKVVFTMVDKSCKKECSCPSRDLGVQYAKPGEKAYVEWKAPKANCTGGAVDLVERTGRNTSGYYGVGSHTILYDYGLAKNITKTVAKCSVKFEVKECSCPSRDLGVQYAKPGEKAYVEWKAPKANCTGGAVDLVERTGRNTSGYYGVGSHTILYDYGLAKNITKTVAKCSVKFEVKDCKPDLMHPDCVSKPALQCKCFDTERADTYLEHGKGTVKWIWEKPEIRCEPNNKTKNVLKEVVTPEGTESPKYFEAGSHTITYKFTYQNGTKQLATLECPITLKVENCSCPSRDLDVQYAKPGEKAYVEWKVPEASCTGGTVDLVEKTGRTTSGYYGVGSHTILYHYGLTKNNQKTVAKCSVKFEVKVCSCPSKDLGVFYMSPESDIGCKLPWARPKPNCPGLHYSRTSPSIGGAGEKEPYAIGKHIVTYIYSMSNGLQVKCHVKLEMRVECGGEEYDPDKKQCCYGKLHDNQNPLWMCCGTAYYNPKLHKCCDLRNAHIVSTSGGECPNECASFSHWTTSI